MLLKYLNQLDAAIERAERDPGQDALDHCIECLHRVEAYLDTQIEPVRERGREIIAGMMSPALNARIHGTRVPLAAGCL